MSDAVITFDSVSKSYPLYHHVMGGIKHFLFNLRKGVQSIRKNRFEVFRDISFEVQRGESFGIIGSNGSGKSTTLGLIAGVLKPTSGKVTIKGRISPFLELGAGFHPELTGRENILLCGVLMGLTRAEVSEKMSQIIEYSELSEFIDQPIRVYSSGMLARLGFSVVAHLDPEILLIDEVLAVGDMHFQKKCHDTMLGFRERGVTMVFVSHALPTVVEICDRAMWLDNHTVKALGPPSEVTAAYTAAAVA
jgi:lipopolysaccharide transport system ATP-binding protein